MFSPIFVYSDDDDGIDRFIFEDIGMSEEKGARFVEFAENHSCLLVNNIRAFYGK